MVHDTLMTRIQAVKILSALIRDGGGITAWCREHGVDRCVTARVLDGTRGSNVSVRWALAIETATQGKIPVAAWGSK